MQPNPPRVTQVATPYLSYDDAPAALDFLCNAFGFEELYRLDMPDGRIGHAELALGGVTAVMVASAYSEMGLASPLTLPAVHSQVQCYVDDVDAHFERAKAAGATVVTAPDDQFYGDRIYRALDPEGHRWIFSTHVRDVSVDDLKSAVKEMG